MARPKKNDSEILKKHLPAVRCSESEYQKIQQLADELDMSISEYIRSVAVNAQIKISKRENVFDPQLINQLRKIGTNLNQQTKKLNIFGNLDKDHKRVWLKLESVLDQIIEAY